MEFSQFIVIILVAIVSYLLGLKNGSNGGGSESAAGFMVDKATGVQFPTNKKFISSKKNELSCVGVGTRKKAVLNIYSLGLFISSPLEKQILKENPQGNALCKTIQSSNAQKAIELSFVMNLGPEKIAEAVSQIDGVKEDIKTEFHDLIVDGLGGGKIKKGEKMTFEWKGSEITVTARGKLIGKMNDKALASGVLDLYLGSKSVSPSLLQNLGCK